MSLKQLLVVGALFALVAGCWRPAPTLPATRTLAPVASVEAAAGPPSAVPSPQADYWPTQEWRTSTPEQQGMDSARLAAMFQAVAEEKLGLHSLLVVRHGYIVAEAYFPPFRPETRHVLYSCTKSFASALIGIALDKGYIDRLDRPVLGFFPRQTFAKRDRRKEAMTLEHLLTMTSGLDWEEGDPIYRQMYRSKDWVKFVLDRPMAVPPGEQFNYCSGCSHVLSAIVAKTTPKGTLDFARRNLFQPLGMRDVQWETDGQGIPNGGWGLNLTPRDMARFGYLYLHQGTWDGQQVISADWVQRSVQRHVGTGGELYYGYQWWVNPSLGGYAALGRDGQMIFVMPKLDLVVVFTAQVDGHEAEFGLIGQHIVPAVRSAEPLPANAAGQAALKAAIEAVEKT